jgi:ADP-ribosylation factor-like protein 6
MGFFDKLFSFFGFGRREVNVLVVGLNNSGKSTVLNHFKAEDQRSVDIVPTVGFNVEKFSSKLHYIMDDLQNVYKLILMIL